MVIYLNVYSGPNVSKCQIMDEEKYITEYNRKNKKNSKIVNSIEIKKTVQNNKKQKDKYYIKNKSDNKNIKKYILQSQFFNVEKIINKPKIFLLKDNINDVQLRCVHLQSLYEYDKESKEILQFFLNKKNGCILGTNEAVVKEIIIINNNEIISNFQLFFFDIPYICQDIIILNQQYKIVLSQTNKLKKENYLKEEIENITQIFPIWSDQLININIENTLNIKKTLLRVERRIENNSLSITEKYYGEESFYYTNLLEAFILTINIFADLKEILIEHNSFINDVHFISKPGGEIVYELIKYNDIVRSFFENYLLKRKNNQEMDKFNSQLEFLIQSQIIFINDEIQNYFQKLENYAEYKLIDFNNAFFIKK